jgi:hypothetical protein
MFRGKSKLLVLLISFIFPLHYLTAQNNRSGREGDKKVLEYGLQLLKRYFEQDTLWHVAHPETERSVKGLIHFIEDQPLDAIQSSLGSKMEAEDFRFVYRLPEHVADSLQVPGYISSPVVRREMERISSVLQKKYFEEELAVPVSLVSNLESRAGIISHGAGKSLFDSRYYQLPDSLQLPDVIPDAMMQSPNDFRRFLRLDSIRNQYIEEKRKIYNDSIVNAYRNTIIDNYRRQMYDQERNVQYKRLNDSVKVNNYQVLKQYNDDVIAVVNDSIMLIVAELMEYAHFIDTTTVIMSNLLGEEAYIFLQQNNPYFARVWLKNEQNDSLRLLVKSTGKRSMQMLIDDGVTFSRFKPRQTKDFDFSTLNQRMSGLTGVRERYQVLTPWRIGGDGNVGFTQTYLENWKKGGQSALSLQIVLKGHANYSRHDGKVKWENSSEIRNGYIRPGGEGAELQKNDDKFEVTSRFGVSAFKKWFYSAEFNYETQFFNGYRYPRASNPTPISGFMSPARTFFKVGLDYKPNNNFSLLLSPLTAKNVFVRDTARIDQTKFGIDRGSRSMWEPGLNTDIFFRKNITPEITYETKYKMFINYLQPFGNLDMNWENLVVMRLTDNINMRLLVHMIYDENVLFPVYDANDVRIGEKPKLQLREFFTVGFAYKINKQVTRTRRKS